MWGLSSIPPEPWETGGGEEGRGELVGGVGNEGEEASSVPGLYILWSAFLMSTLSFTCSDHHVKG